MPRRKFVYGSSGVVEVTPDESRELCEELSRDAESRKEPIEGGLPRSRRDWRNVSGHWPVHSDSMACSSIQQVREEQEFLRSRGVNTEHDTELRPIWTGRAHKKAYLRAMGYADGDAGYGDAEPLNIHSGIKRMDVTNPETRKQLRQESLERLQKSEHRLFGKVLTHH